MVKSVEYIECDCKEGRLEYIASTARWERIPGQIMSEPQATYFYGCSKCDAIYSRIGNDRIIRDTDLWLDVHIGDTVIRMQVLRRYEGKLTKEEIIAYAKECYREIDPEDEAKIIKKRSETK